MVGESVRFAGRTAVITGASRGIGLECARAIHAAGVRVALVARNLEAMHDEFVQRARPADPPVSAHRCDVSDPADIARTCAAIHETLGGAPDILVNNAGQFLLAPVEETTVAAFEQTLRVNLVSQFAFVSAFLGEMRRRNNGHVVTIGSIADTVAFAENSAYAASKFGARGLHEVLRAELRGTGVRTTLVSPGPVNTTLWDAIDPEKRKGHTPRHLMLDAAAVADAVVFVVTRPPSTNIDELRLSHS